jgi:DNA-directed RNA polymerase specialized sigma24 family protein
VTSGGAKPLFAEGEAEALVCAVRAHLRAAEQAERDGQEQTARRERASADLRFTQLMERLLPRLEQRARAAFAAFRAELVEEGVAEMYARLWQGISDTRTDRETARHWERRFNQCAACVLVDAVRAVRRRNGMDGGSVAAERFRERRFADLPQRGAEFSDPAALRRLEEVLGAALLRGWRERLPDARYGEAFYLHRLEGWTWAEVAERLGGSERSTRLWAERGEAILRAYIAETFGTEGKGNG